MEAAPDSMETEHSHIIADHYNKQTMKPDEVIFWNSIREKKQYRTSSPKSQQLDQISAVHAIRDEVKNGWLKSGMTQFSIWLVEKEAI